MDRNPYSEITQTRMINTDKTLRILSSLDFLGDTDCKIITDSILRRNYFKIFFFVFLFNLNISG